MSNDIDTTNHKHYTRMNHHHHHHLYHPSPRFVVMRWPRNSSFAILAAVMLVILYCFATSSTSKTATTATTTQPSSVATASQQLIVEKQVYAKMGGYSESIPIKYYHCNKAATPTPSNSNKKQQQQHQQQLVLLHGSRFTKEDWKTSGILQQFCQQEGFSVIALDLSVKASYADLVQVLNQLSSTLETLTLPVQGLVTPSASGKAIIDGLLLNNNNKNNSKETTSLKDLTERWIPVACLGLLQVAKQQSSSSISSSSSSSTVQLPPSWPILAVHGDQDKPGKQSSELLLSWSHNNSSSSSSSSTSSSGHPQVTIQELPGRHPCYLDSPGAFVQAVTAFLKS